MDLLHKLSTCLYKRCAYSEKKSDHRGLTLVELICAIAIMSLVGAGVSGFMILGANTYRSGTTEVELQTEAQLVVNQIGDLVIDTTAEVFGYKADGTTLEKERAEVIKVECATSLYEVKHIGDEVYYSEYTLQDGDKWVAVSSDSEAQLMANYVTEFQADVSEFPSSGILHLYLKLEKDNRAYAAYYTITARNGSYTVEGDTVDAAATVVAPNEIVVEPNQKYPLSATVVGISNTSVTWSLSNNSSSDTYVIQESDGWYLHVGSNEIRDMMLSVSTVEMNDATPLSTTSVKVHLRRVNDLELYGVLISGESMKEGAVYRISPKFVGSNLDRFLGLESLPQLGIIGSDDYVDPYTFNWLPLEVNGVSADKFKLETHGTYADLTLKDDFEIGEVTVSARALHPDGTSGGTQTNRTGEAYSTGVIGEWTLKPTSGWLRGGESPVLSEILGDLDVDGLTHDDIFYELDWDIMQVPGGTYKQAAQQSNNMNTLLPDGRKAMSTWSGILSIYTPGDASDLKEGLVRSWYSYSAPYYSLYMYEDNAMSVYKLRLTLTATNKLDGTVHKSTVEFEIPDVTISYRNSNPNDSDGAWSDDRGTHIVYITDEDAINTYTSYFMLVDGWISEGVTYDMVDPLDGQKGIDWDNPINYNDYILLNRFVGVIEDNSGVETDKRYDLTFVDANNLMYKNILVPYNQTSRTNVPTFYSNRLAMIQEIGVTENELLNEMTEWYNKDMTQVYYIDLKDANLKSPVISRGENGQCTIAVFVTQDEKDMLCANGGITITERYEYNPLFCTNDLYTWSTQDWTREQAARAESVDGCLGYLEYRFRESNIVLDGSSVIPKVMYCPLASDNALVKGYYYIDEDTRYKVSGDVAEYQTKPHGAGSSAFTTQLWLDLKEDGKWHAR